MILAYELGQAVERDGSCQGFVDKNEGPSKQKAPIRSISKITKRTDEPTNY